MGMGCHIPDDTTPILGWAEAINHLSDIRNTTRKFSNNATVVACSDTFARSNESGSVVQTHVS